MKTKHVFSILALFAAAFCGSFAFSHGAVTGAVTSTPNSDLVANSTAADSTSSEPEAFQSPSPFPDKTCPGLPSSKCCLFQVFKMGEGQREAKYDAPYNCETGTTMQGDLMMKVPFHSGGANCDPLVKLIPDGSVLEAKGHVIRRSDGFGDFNGDFLIRDPAGKILFNGCIETLDRVGTHPSCEKCLPDSHYEGLLVGRGAGALANFSIRASIAGRGLLPSPTSPKTATAIVFNGALVKCP